MHTFSVVFLTFFRVFAVSQAGSYLTLGTDDCFERVSIGKRLNSSDVTKTISTSNLKHCSNECERMLCNTYSFGVNGNGNGTCLLGLDLPKSGPYDDPEYDLFMKILQCRDRTMCFIKLVGGRRLIDKYIQRTLPVETKGDCELYCEYEKEFHCAGFNFKYDMKLDSYSSCQLTSVPSEKLDLSVDFQSEVDYDFYEKNVNASPSCRYLEFPNLYAGQVRKWDITSNGQDLSLWQDVNPSLWYQKNDIAYGNDPVYYDRGIQSTPSVPLSITPNVQFPSSGINPTLPTEIRPPIVSPNECFIKARTGHHLQTENIVKSMNAPSLYGCEMICANEQSFICNIFSYRYSFTSSTDNCHLSDKIIRQLDIFQDLVPDRDSDVFARNELSQPGCQPAKNWDTDCFERIRSGLTFEVSIIKFSVQTENVHECELICLHVKHFTCRVFSFRRGSAAIGNRLDNCYLTDYPVIDMDPVKHLVEDSSCDIYNRGSYGRGCELDKAQDIPGWPLVPVLVTQTPTVFTTYRPEYGVPPSLSSTPSSYGPKYGPPTSPPLQFFPITPSPSPLPIPPRDYPVGPPPTTYYPVTSTRPTSVYVPSQPPTTFFQIPGEYTPVSVRPLNPDNVINNVFNQFGGTGGLNPTQAPPLPLYGTAKKLCYINFGRTARLLPTAVKKTMTVVSEHQCKLECDKARDSQTFRCSTLSYFEGYCELSDIEMRDLKPNQDFSLDPRFLMYTWNFNEVHCFSSPAAKFPPVNNIPNGLEWTWMRFTVNGQPCSSGSYCTQNLNLGIWSCPVSQGDWDYCCRPNHKCGYSEGVSYPWCYVGNSVDQWRPCSDQYFPSTDGQPQTWPVTYIHNIGPPSNPATGAPIPSYPSSPPHRTDDDNNNNNKNSTQTFIEHTQSLVDKFLSLFSSASIGEEPTTESAKTVGATAATNQHVTTDLPGFRVVDVSDRSPAYANRAAAGSISRLYSYSTSNRFRNRFTKRKPYI